MVIYYEIIIINALKHQRFVLYCVQYYYFKAFIGMYIEMCSLNEENSCHCLSFQT